MKHVHQDLKNKLTMFTADMLSETEYNRRLWKRLRNLDGMKKTRILKWAGGKYPLVDDISVIYLKGNCLIEPFMGAGSVFLNTEYDSYILADINSDLIHLYNTVKTVS